MIKAKDGEVIFRGARSNIMAEAVTVLRALKEELSEEEVDEIEVKVKDLNMQFKAWRDEKQREENR
jgi:hypothetical protein